MHERSIPTGLEPVTVVARGDAEAWVVNQLSDTVSIVDLDLGTVLRTLHTGDEPTDVAFAAGRAFVTVAGDDAVQVFDLANLVAPPTVVPLFSRKPRALAVSLDGTTVYAVALFSGNQTAVVHENEIWNTGSGVNLARLSQLGLNPPACVGPKPSYPPLPVGIARNPDLLDPPVDPDDPNNLAGFPQVGLIVHFDETAGEWRDEAGQNWNGCLPFRLPDSDLFVIDATTLAVSTVAHLGTSLFEVSVQPGTGKVWVPNTDARNSVRFEHPLGVRGHVVDNRLSIVDPAAAYAVLRIDLNAHINRASDPAANQAEREASISQPGMLVWNSTGTEGYLTGLGSRKLFRVDGTCAAPACIFGPSRAAPRAVEVGEGPSGLVLDEAHDRVFVLNRFSNSIAVVEASTLTKVGSCRCTTPVRSWTSSAAGYSTTRSGARGTGTRRARAATSRATATTWRGTWAIPRERSCPIRPWATTCASSRPTAALRPRAPTCSSAQPTRASIRRRGRWPRRPSAPCLSRCTGARTVRR